MKVVFKYLILPAKLDIFGLVFLYKNAISFLVEMAFWLMSVLLSINDLDLVQG